jgi:hypothetical protein
MGYGGEEELDLNLAPHVRPKFTCENRASGSTARDSGSTAPGTSLRIGVQLCCDFRSSGSTAQRSGSTGA